MRLTKLHKIVTISAATVKSKCRSSPPVRCVPPEAMTCDMPPTAEVHPNGAFSAIHDRNEDSPKHIWGANRSNNLCRLHSCAILFVCRLSTRLERKA